MWVVGALPIQGDLQVAGVIWKGRRWRFEGRRRACRVAGGVYLTHRRWGGSPNWWYTLNTGVVHLIKHQGCGTP